MGNPAQANKAARRIREDARQIDYLTSSYVTPERLERINFLVDNLSSDLEFLKHSLKEMTGARQS